MSVSINLGCGGQWELGFGEELEEEQGAERSEMRCLDECFGRVGERGRSGPRKRSKQSIGWVKGAALDPGKGANKVFTDSCRRGLAFPPAKIHNQGHFPS
jgi:hypothetical protein